MSKKDCCRKLVDKLEWMQQHKIWPNGLRYLWTDAHGVCALLTLYHELQDEKYLDLAEDVVAKVYQVLGRKRGLRIGEEPDRDGQYFHYLTKWMYALNQLGKIKPEYHQRAVALAKDIHKSFVVKGVGIYWKMLEDLSGPYPGFGLGGLDFYDGYVQYKLLDPAALSSEIGDMVNLIQKDYPRFHCTQELGLGDCLWLSHFFPQEPWAQVHKERSIKKLDEMWVETENGKAGYFSRYRTKIKFGFANFGVSYGIQTAGIWPERVQMLHGFFECYNPVYLEEYRHDCLRVTHVMYMNSLLPGVLNRSYPR